MKAARLLALYARMADAPDAVARLRRFVLDLAVRGKLVAQDARDEPASMLLKRIRAQKEKRSQRDADPATSDAADPFALPIGWAWTSVGEVCSKTGSGSTPRGGREVYAASGFPFLRSQNVYDDGLRMDDVAYIDEATHERMAGTAVRPGDLLLNITGGSIGRCCRIPQQFAVANVSQHVAILRPAVEGMQGFLHALIRSPYFQAFVVGEQTGAGRGGLPKNRMDRIAVALPPLAEQHRIVAKVDELMALFDRLEAARTAREATRDRLAAASLARINTPNPETFPANVRFALDALPALTTRPDQINPLRQTILNLAVRGKLVPQDARDEPASMLLKRIRAQKEKRSQRDADSATSDATNPFALPIGWAWTSIGEVCSKTGSGSTPRGGREVYAASGVPFLRSQNVYDDGLRLDDVAYIDEATHERMAGTAVRPGDLLLNITGGSIGRCCSLPQQFAEANISQHVAILRPAVEGMQGFLHTLIRSPYFQAFVVGEQTGAGRGGLPKNRMDRIVVALPPLSEQHRIVAKVNELTALCDALEGGVAAATTARTRLLEATLAEALAPAEARALEPA